MLSILCPLPLNVPLNGLSAEPNPVKLAFSPLILSSSLISAVSVKNAVLIFSVISIITAAHLRLAALLMIYGLDAIPLPSQARSSSSVVYANSNETSSCFMVIYLLLYRSSSPDNFHPWMFIASDVYSGSSTVSPALAYNEAITEPSILKLILYTCFASLWNDTRRGTSSTLSPERLCANTRPSSLLTFCWSMYAGSPLPRLTFATPSGTFIPAIPQYELMNLALEDLSSRHIIFPVPGSE